MIHLPAEAQVSRWPIVVMAMVHGGW
uniref:Uncharacterized protein n=1 Tax=Arundo donax TaxID=35708 RepID=A0A0A9A911_ARUDO